MKLPIIKVKMGNQIVDCCYIGDAESTIDEAGKIHRMVRVYKSSAHPSSTFRIRANSILKEK